MEMTAIKRLLPILQQKPEAKAGEGFPGTGGVTSSRGQPTGRVTQPVKGMARQ